MMPHEAPSAPVINAERTHALREATPQGWEESRIFEVRFEVVAVLLGCLSGAALLIVTVIARLFD